MEKQDVAEDLGAPSFSTALTVWARIGLLSFGGPAAQIALMHRVLVDERKWLDERQFLSALSFCMLLPGPEAMQLATYSLRPVPSSFWYFRCSMGRLERHHRSKRCLPVSRRPFSPLS